MKSNGGLLFSAGIDIGSDFIIDHSAFSFDYDLAQELRIRDEPNTVYSKIGEGGKDKGQ